MSDKPPTEPPSSARSLARSSVRSFVVDPRAAAVIEHDLEPAASSSAESRRSQFADSHRSASVDVHSPPRRTSIHDSQRGSSAGSQRTHSSIGDATENVLPGSVVDPEEPQSGDEVVEVEAAPTPPLVERQTTPELEEGAASGRTSSSPSASSQSVEDIDELENADEGFHPALETIPEGRESAVVTRASQSSSDQLTQSQSSSDTVIITPRPAENEETEGEPPVKTPRSEKSDSSTADTPRQDKGVVAMDTTEKDIESPQENDSDTASDEQEDMDKNTEADDESGSLPSPPSVPPLQPAAVASPAATSPALPEPAIQPDPPVSSRSQRSVTFMSPPVGTPNPKAENISTPRPPAVASTQRNPAVASTPKVSEQPSISPTAIAHTSPITADTQPLLQRESSPEEDQVAKKLLRHASSLEFPTGPPLKRSLPTSPSSSTFRAKRSADRVSFVDPEFMVLTPRDGSPNTASTNLPSVSSSSDSSSGPTAHVSDIPAGRTRTGPVPRQTRAARLRQDAIAQRTPRKQMARSNPDLSARSLQTKKRRQKSHSPRRSPGGFIARPDLVPRSGRRVPPFILQAQQDNVRFGRSDQEIARTAAAMQRAIEAERAATRSLEPRYEVDEQAEPLYFKSKHPKQTRQPHFHLALPDFYDTAPPAGPAFAPPLAGLDGSGSERSPRDKFLADELERTKPKTTTTHVDPNKPPSPPVPAVAHRLAAELEQQLDPTQQELLQALADEQDTSSSITGVTSTSESESNSKKKKKKKLKKVKAKINEELSSQVMTLASEGEWELLGTVLRTAGLNELDLSLRDTQGYTALLLAIKHNQGDIIDRLVELGGDVNDLTTDNRSAAHIIAHEGSTDLMRRMHEQHGMYLGHVNDSGLPLHLACSRTGVDALTMVQLLIEHTQVRSGEDCRLVEDANGCLPLHLATQARNPQIIHELLRSDVGEQTRRIRKDTQESPLHMAVRQGNLSLARFLLEHNADVDVQDLNGATCLHLIAEANDFDMLRLFYHARADSNIRDSQDRTPLHVAAERGHVDMVKVLADKLKSSVLARTKDGSTLMHIAAQHGHPEIAVAFLKRGVPLLMPNKAGWLALHCASAVGHVHMIRTLMAKGANIDVQTKEGFTPMHIAIISGKPQSVECLLGYGADVTLKGGTQGETPLHLAANLDGNIALQCAEMVLKSGAEVNLKIESGETPLHIAARRGVGDMTKLLLNDGADATVISKTGETPLHVASRHCHYEVVRLILQSMEDTKRKEDCMQLVNMQNIDGETAVHCTSELKQAHTHYPSEDRDLIKLLLSYGGDVNTLTVGTNESPIHYCARAGNENILDEIVLKIGAGGVQIALNKQSKAGWSPLLYASERGHDKVVRILLDHHARVDAFDEHGRTALHLAAESGYTVCCDTLLEYKAFINSKTKLGVTPLHFAAMMGHIDVVQLLVKKHQALVDATTLDNRTPLHMAAKHGMLSICSELIALGANNNARDSRGQTPLHLAAESDFPDIVKIFLKMNPDLNTLTATDENGFTCAHIAAMKGSVQVVKELMLIDQAMVVEALTKTTESNTLHLASAGGHKKVVKVLLDKGSSAYAENANGMTPLHLAAKFGHIAILECVEKNMWRYCSKKTGLTPLHVASHFGQVEFVRLMLFDLPATIRSEPPGQINPLVPKEMGTDYGLTPLHMAAQSGHENLVRLVLNFSGVIVDSPTTLHHVIPLHLAAQKGHAAVVGLLLSRSTNQLHSKDSTGRTSLHLASMNGHYDMVSLLIGQGSNINAMDHAGWTALHFATKAGHMGVVRLLLESGSDPLAETKDGKVALCFAASSSHVNVLSHLVHCEHDTYALMDDRQFVYDLMVAGKSHHYKPVEEFVLLSPAPIDTAVKLSSLYREMSTKEKERAKDLSIVAEYCEDMAVELLSIASLTYDAALLLKAVDNRHRPFLDVLIEHEQKKVVSHTTVQRYLTEIWNGGIAWGDWKFVLFFFLLVLAPPLWMLFSLPLSLQLCRAPIVKFICHIISHIYFTCLLILLVLSVITPIYTVDHIIPAFHEFLIMMWLSGMLVAELSNADSRSGLGILKIAMLIFSTMAVIVHVTAFIYPEVAIPSAENSEKAYMRYTILYVKNQLFAVVLLFCFVDVLEFLTVHHLFGPWAIIIRDLMYDLGRFLVILSLFIFGFTLHVTSIFLPAYFSEDDSQVRLANPLETLEMLFYALFGLVEPDMMPPLHRTPFFAKSILKVVFGVYMMVTLIVLINLLIAMMSDTYQRIQAQSDTEWKFGRAKLIRQMNKRAATAPPVNIFTKLYIVVKVAVMNRGNLCSPKAQDDMRHEENIDSYSLTNSGVTSADQVKLLDEDEINVPTKTNHEAVASPIDTVIDWTAVVDAFHKYQGATDEQLQDLEMQGIALASPELAMEEQQEKAEMQSSR